MVSNVAVVGPQDLVNEMIALGSDFPELELIPVPYQKETQAVDLVKSHMQQVEVVSFTGPVPYLLTKGKVPGHLRMVYVRYTGAALYRTLFQVLEQRQGEKDWLKGLSIDILPREAVAETYAELGLDSSGVHIIAQDSFPDTTSLAEQHRRFYESGQSTAAVSCLTSAYEKLREWGIPAYRIRPTHFDMRETLRLAKIESLALHHQKAQVAVGVLRMNSGSRGASGNAQRLTLELHQLLLDYGAETGASVTYLGGNEFIIFTTRGALQRATSGFQEAPLLGEIRERVGAVISLGLGVGHSAMEAEGNARAALARSLEEGGSHCYVLLEGGAMIGPLDAARPLRYDIRSLDPHVMSLAQLSGLSVATVSRLQAVTESYGRTTLTANEVAAGLGVTLRSARRLLSTMVAAHLAVVVGEEQPVGRGRPRQVYNLRIAREGGI